MMHVKEALPRKDDVGQSWVGYYRGSIAVCFLQRCVLVVGILESVWWHHGYVRHNSAIGVGFLVLLSTERF